jgi:hypothetical protein
MLHFQSPLALFSLLALLIPLAIHLLSRKPGKAIKVGSLRFLENSNRHRLQGVKLSELPLLLMRLALLAMLALLLAQPRWLTAENGSEKRQRGWILLAPELLPMHHDTRLVTGIDSLAAAGHELRLFAHGFPIFDLGAAPAEVAEPENYWSLFREAETLLPAGAPLWIFSSDRLAAFHGERPTWRKNLPWRIVSFDQPNYWFHEAHTKGNDSLFIVLGHSDARRTHFSRHALPIPKQPKIIASEKMPDLEIIPKPSSRVLALRLLEEDANLQDNRLTIALSQYSQAVRIFNDGERQHDADYVRSAVEAAAEFASLSLSISSEKIRGDSRFDEQAAMIFWLSEKPVPSPIIESVDEGLILIRDAATQEYQAVESAIEAGGFAEPSRLWRRVAANQTGIALWKDSFGVPLLECELRGEGRYYRFHSRFHPQWNELVLSREFPEWLLSILDRSETIGSTDSKIDRASDRRRLGASQIQPTLIDSIIVSHAPYASTNLHFPFWIVVTALFALERWMAEKRTA